VEDNPSLKIKVVNRNWETFVGFQIYSSYTRLPKVRNDEEGCAYHHRLENRGLLKDK
jgi:hypothetical protein